MEEKTKEQLLEELALEKRLKEERELSNKSYASKIVEVIVFTILGTISLAFLYELITIVKTKI